MTKGGLAHISRLAPDVQGSLSRPSTHADPVGEDCSGQLQEKLFDLFQIEAVALCLLRVLQTLRQASRQQTKAHLIESGACGRHLRDDVAALASVFDHGAHGTHLAFDAGETLHQSIKYFLFNLHGRLLGKMV